MLTQELIIQQYKSFIRNEKWRRNFPGKIIAGLMMTMAALAFFLLGSFMDEILKEVKGEPVETFNSFLLWYFAGDLLLRCLIQPLPALQVIPLLRLPIHRSKLVRFLLFTSFWNFFSLIPFLILFPFSFNTLLLVHGPVAVISYLVGILLIVIVNNYLAVMIGFLIKKNLAWFVIPVSIFAGLYLLEELHLPVRPFSTVFGSYLIKGNLYLMLSLLAGVFIVLTVTKKILFTGLFADRIVPSRQWKFTSGITGLNAFTQAGEIKRNIWLEVNLLIRNKRPRQILALTPFYIGYFIYILSDNRLSSGIYLILLSFLTGFLPSMYGQFLFSWESCFFDGIMVRKGNFSRYLKAKYYLMCIMGLVSFIPFFIVLSFTSKFDPSLFLSLGLFTMGITFFFIMLMGTYNDGRIDLSNSNFFNYQGIRANQFVLTLIFTLLPPGIFVLFKFLANEAVAKWAVALPGLLFIVFHEWWIKKIVMRLFYRHKYKNLEGYRKLTV